MPSLSPATRTASTKAGGYVIAAVSALGLTGASDVATDGWDAVRDRPFMAVGLAVGLALLAWGYRDDFLHRFGVVRPAHLQKQVLAWLHEEQYTITPHKKNAPDFVYAITDTFGNGPYAVLMRQQTPLGLEIKGAIRLTDDHHIVAMRGASPALVRRMRVAIHTGITAQSVAMRTEGDPSGWSIEFSEIVTSETVTRDAFLTAVQSVRRAIGTTILILIDTVETAKEESA